MGQLIPKTVHTAVQCSVTRPGSNVLKVAGSVMQHTQGCWAAPTLINQAHVMGCSAILNLTWDVSAFFGAHFSQPTNTVNRVHTACSPVVSVHYMTTSIEKKRSLHCTSHYSSAILNEAACYSPGYYTVHRHWSPACWSNMLFTAIHCHSSQNMESLWDKMEWLHSTACPSLQPTTIAAGRQCPWYTQCLLMGKNYHLFPPQAKITQMIGPYKTTIYHPVAPFAWSPLWYWMRWEVEVGSIGGQVRPTYPVGSQEFTINRNYWYKHHHGISYLSKQVMQSSLSRAFASLDGNTPCAVYFTTVPKANSTTIAHFYKLVLCTVFLYSIWLMITTNKISCYPCHEYVIYSNIKI